jgi:hypothetical protein
MIPELQVRPGPVSPQGGPQLNALKHGLYSESILLPGDDADEFRRRCLALYRTYRPQTEDEAECIETMAECRWQLHRCRPLQARFDDQLTAPAVDAAGRVCEPVGHQRLHSSMDVTVHRQRIGRMLGRERSKLLELQKLRRLGLIEGAVKLTSGCYMDSSGEVIGPVVTPLPVLKVDTDTMGASGSYDGGNRKYLERKENGVDPTPLAGQASVGRGDAVLSGGDARPTGPELGRSVLSGGDARLTGPEQEEAVLSGAVLLGIMLPGTGGKPPAPAQPTGPQRGAVVPRRLDARGPLIGGFGARRMFAGGTKPVAGDADGSRERRAGVASR